MTSQAIDAMSADHSKLGQYQENDQTLEPKLRESIQQFVRGVLGCTCPDEVFQTIRIDHHPQALIGTQPACSIAIGGRLLILVIVTTNWRATVNELGEILERGRQLRDRERFNRFRLVVATPESQLAGTNLLSNFKLLGMQDNRIHLHVVSPHQLPNIEL